MNQYASIDWKLFRERLRGLRYVRGADCKTTSQLCGLHDKAISEYERGKRKPSADALVKISDHFMVSVDYLLGRDLQSL